MSFPKNIPSLYIQNEGEDVSTKVALSLTQARDKVVVRLTGGCGLMSDEHANGMYHLLSEPFRDFGGAMLFGGTSMISRTDPAKIVPGITEVAPLVRNMCPDARIFGVIARADDFQIDPCFGLIVANEPEKEFVTIAHPNQDVCLVLQKSVDQATVWDAEYQMCARIVHHLQDYAGWESVLLVYNGGGITEKEILLWASKGLRVVLVRGSGRKADEYAKNQDFLDAHPSVVVVESTTSSIREQFERFGVVPVTHKPHLRAVPKSG